jgi:hypothetical protein
LFFVAIGALLYFHYNKKSYNVTVVVVRPRAGTNVFDYEVGKTGKHYKDRSSKEVRFKIYNAKKLGIRYNNEAIEDKYMIRRFDGKGKANLLVFMKPNSQGWLEPILMNLDGKAIFASVENQDLSYYETELQLMDALFNRKSFMERYYLLFLIILMVVVVCIQWYAAAQIHDAAQLNLQAQQVWADAMTKIAPYLQVSNQSVAAPQVVHLG